MFAGDHINVRVGDVPTTAIYVYQFGMTGYGQVGSDRDLPTSLQVVLEPVSLPVDGPSAMVYTRQDSYCSPAVQCWSSYR